VAVELFTNEATTTVSSGGTTAPSAGTVETWAVASSASFPAISSGQQFHVADPASATTAAEIVAVTAVSGTSWTVTRGAESTVPVAHSTGFTVQQLISAASLNTFAQAGNGDLGGTGIAPTVAKVGGSVTSGQYARGNGSAVVLAAIQAADVPGVNGVTVSGTPSSGKVLTATGSSTASWQTPGAAGVYVQPSGDTSGATDVTNLQTALTSARTAGGGRVKGQPGGVFYINAALVIGSGTTLDMTDCFIHWGGGNNIPLVINYGQTAAATATDAAITSGMSVITTSLGAVAVAGQTVLVAGATVAGGTTNLTGIVSAQTSTTITITDLPGTAIAGSPLAAGSTVSSAAIGLYNRDTDIHILGGYWEAGTATGTTKIKLYHVDHQSVDVQGMSCSSTAQGLFADLANGTDAYVNMPNLLSTAGGADGLHIHGPFCGVFVKEITGQTGDDCCSITATDYVPDVTCGNIINITVESINCNSITANCAKVIAGEGSFVDQVKFGHISGSGQNHVAWLGDDALNAGTIGGTYGSIDFGVIDGTSPSDVLLMMVTPNASQVRAVINGDAGNQAQAYIQGNSVATIQNLYLSGTSYPGTQSFLYVNTADITIEHLVMDGCGLLSTNTNGALLYVNAGTVVCADLIGCTGMWNNDRGAADNGFFVYYGNGAGAAVSALNIIGGYARCSCAVFNDGTTASVVTFAGGFYAGTFKLLSLGAAGTTTVNFAGCQVFMPSNPAVVVGATSTLITCGSQLEYANNNGDPLFSVTSGGVVKTANQLPLTAAVYALTDGATIAVPNYFGNVFTVTLGGNRTMAAPASPVDGQVIRFRLTQDGTGSRTVSWNSVYDFGAAGAPTLSTAAGKTDIVAFEYVATGSLDKWVCLGSQLGN
jgi:hypothetical protein